VDGRIDERVIVSKNIPVSRSSERETDRGARVQTGNDLLEGMITELGFEPLS